MSINFDALRVSLEGECHDDMARRGIYSTDASIYQITPAAVVFPRSQTDVLHALNFAQQHALPLVARGGGTSLAGQAVNRGIVLDFTKYMHSVIEYRPNEHVMRVDPGISRDEVNAIANKDGLEFAPDPATSSRATIGGMTANNSSGTKSILYGKTIDHVSGIKVMLTDGSVHELTSTQDRASLPPPFDQLMTLTANNADLIKSKWPKTMRRVNGYCLDELINEEGYHPHKIFVGSEGTLGIILEVTIDLVPIPKHKAVAVVHFSETIDAVKAVATMLEYRPAAIEILSDDLVNYSKKNLATRGMSGWVRENPKSIQIVEFYSDELSDIDERATAMFEDLKSKGLGYAYDIYPEGDTYNAVWDIRKRGLGLLLGEPNDQRGIAFIEDAAIPVEHLPEYIERVMEICEENNTRATYYAHASVGVIHVRPILNLRSKEDISRMKEIARRTFELVQFYGGAWSGEHGDGLVRSGFLPEFFGPEAFSLITGVKALFDPDKLLNPGVITDTPPMDSNLRYGDAYADKPIHTEYQYREQHNFNTAVHQCTGIGSCRKIEGGTMCPSYMVTRDDLHSTRGRANALRMAMSGQLEIENLHDTSVLEAMDLCLSCKACKAECPSSVDMARLKGEVLQSHYDADGASFRDKLIRDSSSVAAKFAGPLSHLVNWVQGKSVFKAVLQSSTGFSRKRTLPSYASETFSSWFKKHYRPNGFDRSIGLFADTYTNFHEPEIGKKAVEVITALGFDIDLLEGCCQRPSISHGFLRHAREKAKPLIQGVAGYSGLVLGIEPGCISALTDDLPDLIADAVLAENLKGTVVPIGLWLADQMESQPGVIRAVDRHILLHGHCHQKAMHGTAHIHKLLTLAGAEVFEPDSGCCGMGGSFGYEAEHFEISKALAERVLVPSIKEHPTHAVAAPGFSCRHQIAHFAGKTAVHWLELLETER